MPLRIQAGFTMIEMVIGLVLGVVLVAAVTNTFISQQRTYSVQDQIVEMMQNAMVGINLMQREIMMAGYDPTDTAGAGVVAADASSLQFTMDLTDDTGTGAPDGDTADAGETVSYVLFDADADGDLDLGRDTGGGNQLVAENIESLALTYMLADGTETSTPTAGQLTQLRMIEVTLTARTANRDPKYATNGGYRSQQLTLAIQLRNL